MIKSTKFVKLITMVMAMVICCSLILTLSACDGNKKITGKDPTPEDNKVEELFPNGSFYQTSGSTLPYTATNWSGLPGSSSGDNATPNAVPKELIYGVISGHPISYDKNKEQWDNLPNPGINAGGVTGDGNMMMIYNKVPTAYKFTNTKMNLEMGNYYKISVDVKTVNLEGDAGKGAYIYFSDAAISSFEKIDTNGEWRTYSLYIESSVVSNKTLGVTLALGYGSKIDGKLTKGYAFFDNVKAELVSEETFNNAYSIRDNKEDNQDAYSLRFLNGNFENSTGSDTFKTATNYSTITGTGKESTDNAHTTSSYTTRGIIDLIKDKEAIKTSKNFDVPDPCGIFDTPAKENLALLIRNTDQNATGTAAGYMSSKFYVPMGKVAKITVYIWTDITNEDLAEKDKRGVYIVFSGDTDPFESQAIRTNKTWEKHEFYIDATVASSPYIFSMEMWLGTGGRQSYDYHAKGVAIFDNISLEYIDEVPADTNKSNILTCPGKENIFKNGQFTDGTDGLDGWQHGAVEDVNINLGDVDVDVFSQEQVNNDPFLKTPLAPVLMIKNNVKSAYKLTTELKDAKNELNKITIDPHKYYKLSLWVKTKDIEKSKGATIEVYSKDKDDVRTALYTYSNVNTLDYNNYSTNGYREYVLYVEGHEIDSKEYFLEVKLGTGTQVDPTNYLSGSIYITNVRFSSINYNEYNNATTSSYVNKKSITSTSNEISNGNFNKFDMKESKFEADGSYKDAPLPSNFIKVGGSASNFEYGIMDIKSDLLRTKYGIGTESEVFNGWNNTPLTGHIADGGKPYFLFIKNKNERTDISAEKPQKAFGYKTESFSLTSSSYYLITVDVKTVSGKASLYFSTTSGTNEIKFENIDTNGHWEQYTFAVEVGLSSTSVELAMYLGETRTAEDKTIDETTTTGEVYFDNVLYTKYDKIEDYKEAKDKYLNDNSTIYSALFGQESFVTDTFDRTTGSSPLDKPYTSNWTGSVAKIDSGSAPSGEKNQIVGVLTKDTDFEDVKTGVYDEGDENILDGSSLTKDMLDDIFNNNGVSDLILGNKVLMMNNLVGTGYNYKTYSSKSFASGKAYEISIWVKTYLIKGAGASITLHVDTNTHTFKNIGKDVDGMSPWTKFTFYVFNEKETSVSSVYMSLILGSYSKANKTDDYSKGYAFFDNMTFKEVDKALYEEKDKEIKNAIDYNPDNPTKVKTETEWSIKYTKDKELDDSNNDDSDEETETPKAKAEFPWLLVSSLIIGGILIIAVIVVLVRYFKKKPKVTAGKPEYDRKKKKIGGGSSDNEAKKNDEYDQYSDKE